MIEEDTNTPRPGCRVHAHTEDYKFSVWVDCDARGRYEIRDAPAAVLSVRASSNRWEGDDQDVDTSGRRVTEFDAMVFPRRRVRGIVLDPEGRPLAGARVSVSQVPVIHVITDAHGRFEMPRFVDRDRLSIWVTHFHDGRWLNRGWSRRWRPDVREFLRLTVKERARAVVTGRVLDVSGRPVASAWVELDGDARRTGPEGRFRFASRPRANATITVHVPAWIGAAPLHLTLRAGENDLGHLRVRRKPIGRSVPPSDRR